MEKIIETSRLILRELNTDDAENFYNLNLNPKVIKYTGDKAFKSIDEARFFLENYNEYKLNGFGRWAVIKKENSEFIGWCGLKYNKLDKETDIGFRFFEDFWNNGFATESAKACISYGFDHLNLRKIIGRAMKDNFASIRVLEKIGLEFEKEIIIDNQIGIQLKIEKN